MHAYMGFLALRAHAELCKSRRGKVKSADYIIVHHTGGKYLSAAKEMDEILAIKHDGFKSVRCRKGKFKEL